MTDGSTETPTVEVNELAAKLRQLADEAVVCHRKLHDLASEWHATEHRLREIDAALAEELTGRLLAEIRGAA